MTSPGQRIATTLLLLTALSLVCFLLFPFFLRNNSVEHPVTKTEITINPLVVNNNLFEEIPPSSPNDNLMGQRLELDHIPVVHIKMYSDKPFLHEQYSFAPSEKLFLVMEFEELEAEDYYHVSALWKGPDGKVVNTSRHDIILDRSHQKYRSYFWLKLLKNGALTELMTGCEYQGDVHGMWTADIYIDGTKIATQQFMVHD